MSTRAKEEERRRKKNGKKLLKMFHAKESYELEFSSNFALKILFVELQHKANYKTRQTKKYDEQSFNCVQCKSTIIWYVKFDLR